MSQVNLLNYTFEQGLREPNYVNGRLLTAEDLSEEQGTTNQRLACLGQAIGSGIIRGLRVERIDDSTLQVSAGKALNKKGQLAELLSAFSLLLTLATTVTIPEDEGSYFAECNVTPPGSLSLLSEGAYLIVIAPVSRLEESVPTMNLGRGQTAACARKWIVAGVEFKAIRLTGFEKNGVADLNAVSISNGVSDVDSLRNRLAHWCLGHLPLGIFPYTGFDGAYSGIDHLGEDCLTPCDVPLATFYWKDNAIQFVDNWAARRNISPTFLAPKWRGFYGDDRWARAEARSMQFQEHLNTFTNKQTLSANQRFPYLPPIGFVPILPPIEVWQKAVYDFLSLLVTNGTTQELFAYLQRFGLGDQDGDGDFDDESWQQFVQVIATTLYQQLTEEYGSYGINYGTFFGGLPGRIYYAPLQYIDIQIRYILPFDALIVEQIPEFRLYFPEEYLFMQIGKLLLSATVDTQQTSETILRTAVAAVSAENTGTVAASQVISVDAVATFLFSYINQLFRVFGQSRQDTWDEQLIHTLQHGLRLPGDVIVENLARNDLMQACFVWEIDEGGPVDIGVFQTKRQG